MSVPAPGIPGGACFISMVDSTDAGNTSGVYLSPRPAAAPGEVIWHRLFQGAAVPHEHLLSVKRHAEAAGKLVGIDTVDLVVAFFVPLPLGEQPSEAVDQPFVATEYGDECMGYVHTYWRSTLALSAGLRGPMVGGVIAHELAHLAQNRRSGWTGAQLPRPERARREREAAAAAAAYIRSVTRDQTLIGQFTAAQLKRVA